MAEIMKALLRLVVPAAHIDARVSFNQSCLFNRGRVCPLRGTVQILASCEVFLCTAHVEKRNKHDRGGGSNDHDSSARHDWKTDIGIRAAAILPEPKCPLKRLIDRKTVCAKQRWT